MTTLRLLADDLTGALDTAAEFVGLTGPVPTFWRGAIPGVMPRSAALDTVTRELQATDAAGIVRALIPHLHGTGIAFKKVDSLFRGPTIAELVTCVRDAAWDYCVLAPAFPFQGRITRGSRQYAKTADGAWLAASDDLVAGLHALDLAAHAGDPDADLRPGITVFDAETDEQLRRIVTGVRRCPRPVLWSGTGGLAQALAAEAAVPEPPPLPRPILGLFGSDHAVTASQLVACAPHATVLPDGGPASALEITGMLAAAGIALASFDLAESTPRALAADHIAEQMNRLTGALSPPGTVVVSGGETLRGLCQSLGATSLEVQGRIMPGVPCSIMRGGRWNGVTVISKSGAFGHPHLLRDLLRIPKGEHHDSPSPRHHNG